MVIFRREPPPPPTGASNTGGVGRNSDFEPISHFTACCQCCDRLGVINTTLPDHSPGRVCWWRETTTKRYDKIFNVTPKTTDQHLIARSGKSVAYVTNNKRLYSTFFTIEYWSSTTDRHEALRGLFATAELLVESLLMTYSKNCKTWWIYVKPIAIQTWEFFLRHNVGRHCVKDGTEFCC